MYNNINKYDDAQLKIKQEIQQTIGKGKEDTWGNGVLKSNGEIYDEMKKRYEGLNKKKEKRQEEGLKKISKNETEEIELNTEKAKGIKSENKEKEFDKYSGGYIKELFPLKNNFLLLEYKDFKNLVSELKSKLNFIMRKYENKFPHEHEIKSSNEEDEILKYKKYGEAAEVLNELMKKCEPIANLKFNVWEDEENSQKHVFIPDKYFCNDEYERQWCYSPNSERIKRDAALFSLRYAYLLQMHCKMLEKIVEVIENNVEYYSSKVNSKDLWYYGNLFNIYYKTFIKLYRNFLNKNFFDDVPEIIEEKWNSFNEVIEKIKNGTQFNKSVKTKNLLENEDKIKREEKLKEQKLKEQKLEQKLKEQKLKEQKLKEQKLEQKLKEQKLKEQKLEQKLKEQKLKEQKLKEQKLKEQKLKEQVENLEEKNIKFKSDEKIRNLENKISSINKIKMNKFIPFNREFKSSNARYEIKYSEADRDLNELMEKCKDVEKPEIKNLYAFILEKHLEELEKLCDIIDSNYRYYFSKIHSNDLGPFAELFNGYYKFCISLYKNFLYDFSTKKMNLILEENRNSLNETIEKIEKEGDLYRSDNTASLKKK